MLGTAGYLAPEQARGERATPASDLYALAVVAFELLTGKRPFERESPTAEAMAHVSAPIPPASARTRSCRRELDDVLARGLAKEPEHRFATAAELVAALRDGARPGGRDDTRRARSPRSHAPRATQPAAAARSCSSAARSSPASSPRRSSPATTARRPPARRRRRETVQETVTLPGHDGRPDRDDRARAAADDHDRAAEPPPPQQARPS